MDFRQLETFVEIINSKSFSKAAKKLFLTQPTVSNHIQNLEKELDTILLNRSNKYIYPTESGTILYKYAQEILDIKNNAHFTLNKYKGKIDGNLYISSSSIPKQYLLPKIIKQFSNRYPDVKYTISHKDSKDVIESILQNQTDFGIVGAKYSSKKLEFIKLMEDEMVIASPYNLTSLNPYSTVDTDFLMNNNIILREQGSGSRLQFEKILDELSINISNLNIIACIEDNETIKQFIKQNLGISIMSLLAIKEDINSNTIKPLCLKSQYTKRNFYFVYNKNKYLSPLAKTFRDYIINTYFHN
ncbi:selenium metabolism-associated LysR family transcriptional regulator [Clostridiaceae bacterium M8S5]|nr:selenium metabolism-associated LysR family transcriptional regulator [Clostridiaceae bacterium M8S5]